MTDKSTRSRKSESVKPSPTTADVAVTASPSGRRMPKAIGRYQVLGELGVGGFGVVYKAHDPQMDREVAIKLLRDDRAKSGQNRSRFLREARVVASISHPNICPIYSIHETQDVVVLVFPFLEGQTLAEVLKTRRFEPAAATQLVHTLAQALEHAHQKGIVHRDLKPANIMIDAAGEPVIMDFGLARRAEAGDTQLTVQGDLLGTPHYMSPEQARGETNSAGAASDIYSLGVILYELLCGQRPYSGPLSSLLPKIQSGEFQPPSQHHPELDQRLDSACLKAMALWPQDRFQSMSEFATFLEAQLPDKADESLAEPIARKLQLAPMRPKAERPATGALQETIAKVSVTVAAKSKLAWPNWRTRKFAWIVAATMLLLAAMTLIGFVIFPRGTIDVPPSNSPVLPEVTRKSKSATDESATVAIPEAMLIGAWDVEATTAEDSNQNGMLDAGEDLNGNGLLDGHRGNEVWGFDEAGFCCIAKVGRVYGGPLVGSEMRVKVQAHDHVPDAGTIRLRFEVTPSAEQRQLGGLATELQEFPSAWQIKFATEDVLEITETTLIPELRDRQISTLVGVPEIQQQADGSTQTRVRWETRQVFDRHTVYVARDKVLRAHRFASSCEWHVGFGNVRPLEAEAGTEGKIILRLNATAQFRAEQIRLSSSRHGTASVRDSSAPASAGGIDILFRPARGFTGFEVLQYHAVDAGPLDAQKWGLISISSKPAGLVARDLFRLMPAHLGTPPSGATHPNFPLLVVPVDVTSGPSSKSEPIEVLVTSPLKHGQFVGTTEGPGVGTLLLFRPEQDYLGGDSCRYKLRRGQEESAEATIRLLIVNSNERAVALPPFGAAPALPTSAAPVPPARKDATPATSLESLKAIGLGMHYYHQVHKKYPAAVSTDDNGKPLLSWRVHILPLIGAAELHQQFHLNEPWDSEHNQTLIAKMPSTYQSGTEPDLNQQGKTRFVVPRGKGTIFENDGAAGMTPPYGSGITQNLDGTSLTIMAVEAHVDAAVIWTKPDDVLIDFDNPLKSLKGARAGGFNVLMADGVVQFLSDLIDPKTLQGLFTMAGNEPVNF